MLNMLQINEPIKDIGPLLALTNNPSTKEMSVMAESTNTRKERICKVEGCGIETKCKGFCNRHYYQMKRSGRILNINKWSRKPNEFIFDGDTVRIITNDYDGNQNGEVSIDRIDLDRIKQHKWGLNSNGKFNYCATTIDGKRVYIHQFIMGRKLIDHIDRDVSNNRRSNLRVCTNQQNGFNSGLSKNNTSGFKGVFVNKVGKSRAAIMKNGESVRLGMFETKRQAAKAYDAKAIELFGEFAATNKELGLL
jgi:hypothetical protein